MAKTHLLVTAGNTWCPVDDVRVVTNIFSGETGLTIAYTLAKKGFNVTCIAADVRINLKDFRHSRLKIIRALTFDCFYSAVKKAVKKRKYAAIIHAAAVSDFKLKKVNPGKLDSGKRLKQTWVPTPKIARKIKHWDPWIKLVLFKLESGISRKKLFKLALMAKRRCHADLVVANKLPIKKDHQFYLIKHRNHWLKLKGKKALAKILASIFKHELS